MHRVGGGWGGANCFLVHHGDVLTLVIVHHFRLVSRSEMQICVLKESHAFLLS